MNSRHLRAAVLIALSAAALTSLQACSAPGPLYDQMVKSADTFANQTGGPALEEYVSNDATIDSATRQIRLDELHAFRGAVAAAKSERSP